MSMQEESKLKEFCSQLLVLFPLLTTILIFIVIEITHKNIFKIYNRANTNTYVWYKLSVRYTPFWGTKCDIVDRFDCKALFYTGLLFAWGSNCTRVTCNPDTTCMVQLENSTSVLGACCLTLSMPYSVTLSHDYHMGFEPWGQLYSAGMLWYSNQVCWSKPTSTSHSILTSSKEQTPYWNW